MIKSFSIEGLVNECLLKKGDQGLIISNILGYGAMVWIYYVQGVKAARIQSFRI